MAGQMRWRIFILLSVAFILGVFIFYLRGPEDTWICQSGQWIKHGQPATPAPSIPCENK